MQAILRWGHLWRGRHIVFYVDNSAIVSALSSGTIQNVQVMNILRWIVMLAAHMGFTYSSSWLTSVDNLLTDAASCFEYGHLFSMAPYMQKNPCKPHPQLHGIRHTLTCLPESLFSSGTALPPWPELPIGQDRNNSQISSSCIHSS